MLKIVVVMLECTTGIIWRVNENALHSSGIIWKKCLQCVKIVAMNDHVRCICVPTAVCIVCFKQAIWHRVSGFNVLTSI